MNETLKNSVTFFIGVLIRTQLFAPTVLFTGLILVFLILVSDVLIVFVSDVLNLWGYTSNLFSSLFPNFQFITVFTEQDIWGTYLKISFLFGLLAELVSAIWGKRFIPRWNVKEKIRIILVVTTVLFVLNSIFLAFAPLAEGETYVEILTILGILHFVAFLTACWYLVLRHVAISLEKNYIN